MAVIVKKTGHTMAIKDVKAHIKYIGFRSQEIERKDGDIYKFPKGQFFNSEFDNVNYKGFIKNLESNKALKYQKSIKAHKFVFSLNSYNYDKYMEKGKDYKQLIRNTLRDYEKKNGVKLEWIATEHRVDGKGKSHHPHCHVVISGVSKADKDGNVTRIKFTKEDFKDMRESFDNELKKEIGTLERSFQKIDHGLFKDVGKGFEMVSKEIEKDIREVEIKKLSAVRSEQMKRKREEKAHTEKGNR